MAYTAPTLEMFRVRFPAFADYPDAQVEAALTDNAGAADDTWLSESDYQRAIMYVAAHELATGSTEDDGSVPDDGSGGIASESFGGLISVTYAKNQHSDATTPLAMYATTSYGRSYLSLVRLNRPGVVAI